MLVRSRARLPTLAVAVATAPGILAMSARPASAHAVVTPGEAPTGAYQRYVLRVPNERTFGTVRVQITFSAGVRVISFDEVPGWTLETTSADGGATFTSASWTGTLPVARFVEFGFIGVNPSEPATLVWPVVQTYADGFLAEWTGPAGSATPASVTLVQAPATAATESEAPAPAGGGSRASLLAGAALVVALLSLGLALRPGRRA